METKVKTKMKTEERVEKKVEKKTEKKTKVLPPTIFWPLVLASAGTSNIKKKLGGGFNPKLHYISGPGSIIISRLL